MTKRASTRTTKGTTRRTTQDAKGNAKQRNANDVRVAHHLQEASVHMTAARMLLEDPAEADAIKAMGRNLVLIHNRHSPIKMPLP